MKFFTPLLFLLATTFSSAQPIKIQSKSTKLAEEIESKVIEWRHHFHQNPELSNREFNTADKIAEHLSGLGLAVQTGVAKTGVVAVLKGGKPGPVVGLRADIDALPVTERVDIPWASKAISTYNNIETGVMHACGHDTHIAILMGVAEVLTKMKADLRGSVKFVFQPAEEGAPPGEEGGAKLMLKEGVMKNPDIDVMFGLHINAQTPVGQLKYKSGGTMAAADRFVIKVIGKQSHGSRPWEGVDPINTSAMIIQGLQSIVSRQTELTTEAAVISVGLIRSGVRNNIIPEEAEMIGTIRTLNTDMQKIIHEKIKLTAESIAKSQGAKAEVTIILGYPVTYNNPELTSKAVQWLENAAGKENVLIRTASTGAEDFSFFANEVPAFYFFAGGCPKGVDPVKTPSHHTPDFFVDDAGMITGMKALLNCTLGYMYEK